MKKATGGARIVIAGVASGVGKTTISTGLMAALVVRGLQVQGYKVGPDYIDPTYHRAATGRPSYNLDTWLSSQVLVRQRFEAGMVGADIAVIEGVMGLFDGRKGTRDTASTAEVARLLEAPVILVVDVSPMGQSVAAVVSGFQRLDPQVHLAGVILNKVASVDHEATLRYALSEWTDVPVVGAINRTANFELPSRHLGLIPVPEQTLATQALVETIEQSVDVTKILAIACEAGSFSDQSTDALDTDMAEMVREVGITREEQAHSPTLRDFRAGSWDQAVETGPVRHLSPVMRMGLAQDAAFSFYYPEVLEMLAQHRVEVVPFSPLADKKLPEDIDLLYLGGGFPEVYAEQLASNYRMREGIRAAIQDGLPAYAECGGYMYLGKSCIDAAEKQHEMVGAIPYTFRMGKKRSQVGYREVKTVKDTLLGPAGLCLRGHEFHWSSIVEPLIEEHVAYELAEGNRKEGYASRNILASYVHLPLAAYPWMMRQLIDSCLTLSSARRS